MFSATNWHLAPFHFHAQNPSLSPFGYKISTRRGNGAKEFPRCLLMYDTVDIINFPHHHLLPFFRLRVKLLQWSRCHPTAARCGALGPRSSSKELKCVSNQSSTRFGRASAAVFWSSNVLVCGLVSVLFFLSFSRKTTLATRSKYGRHSARWSAVPYRSIESETESNTLPNLPDTSGEQLEKVPRCCRLPNKFCSYFVPLAGSTANGSSYRQLYRWRIRGNCKIGAQHAKSWKTIFMSQSSTSRASEKSQAAAAAAVTNHTFSGVVGALACAKWNWNWQFPSLPCTRPVTVNRIDVFSLWLETFAFVRFYVLTANKTCDNCRWRYAGIHLGWVNKGKIYQLKGFAGCTLNVLVIKRVSFWEIALIMF